MRFRNIVLGMVALFLVQVSVRGQESVQLWGNYTGSWRGIFGDYVSIQSFSGSSLPPVPKFPETELAIWAHLGRLGMKFSEQQQKEVVSYVRSGGVLMLYSAVPCALFPRKGYFDLSSSSGILGVTKYCYNKKKGQPTALGREVLGDLADQGNIYAEAKTHGSLGGFCGMKSLIGSQNQTELGVYRLGKGAVIYYAGAYHWGFPCSPDAPYARMLKKLLETVLNQKLRDRYFPVEAAAVQKPENRNLPVEAAAVQKPEKRNLPVEAAAGQKPENRNLPVEAAVGQIPAQVWGNYTSVWQKMLKEEIKAAQPGGAFPPVPVYPATKLAIWAHLGPLHHQFSDQQVDELVSYVTQGGVLVLYSQGPATLFFHHGYFDLSPSARILGAAKYRYNEKTGRPTALGRKVLGDLADQGNIYTKEKTHGALGGLCGMKSLIGSSDQTELGVYRLGKGAVVYHSGARNWGFPCKVDAPYARMLKRLIMTVLDQTLLDKYFPYENGNEAVTVDGRKLHVMLQKGENDGGASKLLLGKLQKITGKNDFNNQHSVYQYVIHVGQTPYVKQLGLDFKSLHPYGYYIVCRDGRNLVLTGKNGKGTGYAVNDFLKRFAGYRKFGKSEILEVLPSLPTLKLPAKIEIREEPDINSYIVAWGWNQEFGRNSRLNAMATHAMCDLVPTKLYGKTHPEYFPYINGRRLDVTQKHPGPWNPCMSNPDLPKLVKLYADSYFKKFPERLALPLGVNDGGGDCQCPGCLEKIRKCNSQYAEFYNLAARVVAKEYPGKLVAFIAYGKQAKRIPRGLKMEPNILVESIGTIVDGQDILGNWKNVGIRHFGIYDYLYAMNGSMIVPQYYPHIMGRHWKKLHRKYHITSMWMEYYPKAELLEAPRAYVLDELAWNMDADIDALLNDYFTKMYENAAPEIHAFFDCLEEIYGRHSQALYPMTYWFNPEQMDVYRSEDLQKLDGLLAAASAKQVSPMVRRRLTATARLYGISRLHIQNHISARAIEKMQKIDSLEKCRRLAALAREGYTAIGQWQKLQYSDAEQNDMFAKGRLKDFVSSQLQPLPYLELRADEGMTRVAEYLKSAKMSVEEFFRSELDKCSQPGYQALVKTQIYLASNQPVNLIRNSSFEHLNYSSAEGKPMLSDHEGLKNVPNWYSWHFPSSHTEFGVTDKMAHRGRHSGYIGENQANGCLIYYAGLKAGCRYRLGCWVRRNRGNVAFQGCGQLGVRMQGKHGWLDKGSAIKKHFTEECENKWQHYEVTFTAPDEEEITALLMFSAPRQSPDVITWFDDISLEMIYQPDIEKKKK